MSRFIIRRLLFIPFMLIGISLIAFILSHSVPADPVNAALGEGAVGNPELVRAYKEHWGLDKSLPEQYLVYLANLAHGDMGNSIISRRSVSADLGDALPATFELATAAIIISLLGVPLGIIAAIKHRKMPDAVVRVFSLVGSSVPVFWLAYIAIFVFYTKLSWFPATDRLDTGITPPNRITGFYTIDSLVSGRWDALGSSLHHLLLPALVLSLTTIGTIIRVSRSITLDVLHQEYLRTAHSKGLKGSAVIRRHALPNILVPVVTVISLSYGNLLSGTVLTETIFAWPGLGRYAFQSATKLDFPGIMGVSIVVALIYITINLIVDLLYAVLDPRIRTKAA
ncbi:MAG TPA: ABC transporter permease [Chloroflexia bacterium]|nr:ABC transporter permease [Chloroflexia bacterium]